MISFRFGIRDFVGDGCCRESASLERTRKGDTRIRTEYLLRFIRGSHFAENIAINLK